MEKGFWFALAVKQYNDREFYYRAWWYYMCVRILFMAAFNMTGEEFRKEWIHHDSMVETNPSWMHSDLMGKDENEK